MPISLAVLLALFLFQYHGTAGVASFFAPVTAIWFVVIGGMGLVHIADDPAIFAAFNPLYGVRLLFAEPGLALLILAASSSRSTAARRLCRHGSLRQEADPDCLAFGRAARTSSQLSGPGCLRSRQSEAVVNPFYLMAPSWALIPLVILATLVTVIASQAVITGAYSMAQQAIALGLLPRMNITHTSESESGQIYISQINWILLVGVVLLVIIFRTSSSLASAYGIAVNVSMLIDTTLAALFFWKARSLPPYLVVRCSALSS